MNEATFDPARELTLYFRCNRAGSKNFVFTYSDGTAYSFIYDEIELNIYRNQGDKKKLISLTHISGITLSSNTVTASITKALSNIPEGEYYWELYRTDLEKTWLTGNAFFHNGIFDGVLNDSSAITVNEAGDDVLITINDSSAVTLASLATTLQTASSDTPLDADTFNFYDVVDAVLKKVTWTNIKATLKTYFDTLYQNILVSGTSIKTVNSTTLLGSGDVAVQATLVSGTNIKTINGSTVLGSGNLTVSGGHTIQDEGTPLTQRTNLNFVGSAVTVTDGGAGPDSTIVTITGATAGGSDAQVQFNDGGTALGGDAGLTYNKTTNVLTTGDLTISDSKTANTFLAAPVGSSGAPTFRAIDRNDLTAAYEQVGTVFTESWTNLTNWTNVGVPTAAVSGGYVTLSGAASTSTNYIKNNSYGKFNLESAEISWTEVVGTIGASTSGIGFALVSQNTLLSTSYANSMMVNIELSSTTTGAIKWYFGTGTTFTLVRTSPALLVPVLGDTLNITLTIYPDRYELRYNINGGKTVVDTWVAYLGIEATYTSVVANAAAFSLFNVGGGSSHKVGPVTVKSLHNKNADYLLIGNSILSGYGCINMYNRAATKMQKRTYSTVEINARPSNSVLDVNANEISAYNATHLILLPCSNDITANGAATAQTDLGTTLTALAAISNAAAPTGYSIANGNLTIATELQRTAVAAIATYNSGIITTYGASNLLHLNTIGNPGSGTSMTGTSATGDLSYTWDGVHPNDYTNGLIADEIIRYFQLVRKDVYENNDVAVTNIASPKGFNTFLNYTSGTCIINSMDSDREQYLSFAGYGTLNSAAMTTAIRSTQSGGENVLLGKTTAGFGVWANSSAVGTYSATKRLEIDYSGRLITGSTGDHVYRTTNAGSDVTTGHLVVDPASSITAGNAWIIDSANGLVSTIANGTRRIASSGLNITDQTTTAGAETNSLSVYVKPADGAITQRQSWIGKQTTLTETTATSFARIALASSEYCGGEITLTVQANDATDFQVRTLTFNYSAVNKAGTLTIGISTPVESIAASTGTLTVTVTAVDSGSGNVDFKADATSSLTQTSLRAQCIVHKNFHGTISAQ